MLSKLDEFMLLMGLDNTYMPNEYWGTIFHYTSPAGMTSILQQDPTNITLWASRFDCLNDISEGTVAEQVFREVCKELWHSGQISDDLYQLVRNVAEAKTVLFCTTDNHTTKVSRAEPVRFVTSFSKNPDSLAMWNYYSKGSKYEGFNLGFFPSSVQDSLARRFSCREISTHIYPVIYKKDEQKSIIQSLLIKLNEVHQTVNGHEHDSSIRYIVSNQLTEWKLVFKSEFFQHEEEVRIITDVASRTKNGQPMPLPVDVKYRYSNGYIVPYIELSLDKEDLTDVTIGPLQGNTAQRETQVAALEEMLSSYGYTVIAKCSDIPIRY